MRALFLGLAAIAASPVAAWEVCDELWFTRNLVYDRAGLCFDSALGRAVFDNTGCIGNTVDLDPAEAHIPAAVQVNEQELGCEVDTSRTALDIPFLAQRMAQSDIPVPSPYESGCFGWRGPAIPLRAAHSADAPVVGEIPKGGDIIWTFEGVGDWVFVQTGTGAMGWMQMPPMDEDSCAQSAG